MQDAQGAGAATLARSGREATSYAHGGRQAGGLVRAVLADDAPLVHLAIRSVLAGMPGYVLAGAAGSVAEAEQLIRRVRPDLLISDAAVAGESGIALCRWSRQASPATTVIILTARDEPLLVQSALAAGAMGFLLKDSPAETITALVRQALTGELALDDRLGRSRQVPGAADSAAELGLSPREREVLEEVLLGLDNRGIAARLCISEDTVKSHIKAIFRKLGARDRAHAVALALGSATRAEPGRTAPDIPRPRMVCR
jgi:DNA-binding NarL/FixJ family response regulator